MVRATNRDADNSTSIGDFPNGDKITIDAARHRSVFRTAAATGSRVNGLNVAECVEK